MTVTPDTLKRALSDGAAATANAQRSDDEIHKAAVTRLDEIQTRLNELRARAMTESPAGDEYQGLIRERGELALVLGRSGGRE